MVGIQWTGSVRLLAPGTAADPLPSFTDRVTEIYLHAEAPSPQSSHENGNRHRRPGLQGHSLNEDGSVADFIMNDNALPAPAVSSRSWPVFSVSPGRKERTGVGAGNLFPFQHVHGVHRIGGNRPAGRGTSKGDIAAGIIDTIAGAFKALPGGCHSGKPYLSGGMARNNHIREVITSHLGTRLHVPSEPQYVGALGAALLGAKGKGQGEK